MLLLDPGFFDESKAKNMLDESAKMMSFDHPHVLGLIGICVDAGPAPYLVMPFMANGSLLSYLKSNRQSLVLPQDEDEENVRNMSLYAFMTEYIIHVVYMYHISAIIICCLVGCCPPKVLNKNRSLPSNSGRG